MKYATPGFYVLALACFLLPWASVTCSVPSFELSENDDKEMKISQTGLQMILGKSSVSIDGKAPTEEERKEMEDDDSPMNLNELNTAPLLIGFPLALLIGLAMSFSLSRIASVAGGVAVAIGIAQFAIGFPITEKIKEMKREAGEMEMEQDRGVAAPMFDMDMEMDKGFPGFMDESEDEVLDDNDPGPNAKEAVPDPEGCNQDETQGTDEEPTFSPFEEGDSGTVEMIPGETMEAMPGDMENSFEMDFNDGMEQGMAGMMASGFERHTEPYFWLSMVCALLGSITGLMQGLGLKVSIASTEPGQPAPAPDPSSAGAVTPAKEAGNITDHSQDDDTGGE